MCDYRQSSAPHLGPEAVGTDDYGCRHRLRPPLEFQLHRVGAAAAAAVGGAAAVAAGGVAVGARLAECQ